MKKIGFPKNGNIHAFFAKCRESPVRAFRCGGGLGGYGTSPQFCDFSVRKASLTKYWPEYFLLEYWQEYFFYGNTDHIFLFLTPPTDSKAGILVPLGRNLLDYFHLELVGSLVLPSNWNFFSEGCESQQSENGFALVCPFGFAVH